MTSTAITAITAKLSYGGSSANRHHPLGVAVAAVTVRRSQYRHKGSGPSRAARHAPTYPSPYEDSLRRTVVA